MEKIFKYLEFCIEGNFSSDPKILYEELKSIQNQQNQQISIKDEILKVKDEIKNQNKEFCEKIEVHNLIILYLAKLIHSQNGNTNSIVENLNEQKTRLCKILNGFYRFVIPKREHDNNDNNSKENETQDLLNNRMFEQLIQIVNSHQTQEDQQSQKDQQSEKDQLGQESQKGQQSQQNEPNLYSQLGPEGQQSQKDQQGKKDQQSKKNKQSQKGQQNQTSQQSQTGQQLLYYNKYRQLPINELSKPKFHNIKFNYVSSSEKYYCSIKNFINQKVEVYNEYNKKSKIEINLENVGSLNSLNSNNQETQKTDQKSVTLFSIYCTGARVDYDSYKKELENLLTKTHVILTFILCGSHSKPITKIDEFGGDVISIYVFKDQVLDNIYNDDSFNSILKIFDKLNN